MRLPLTLALIVAPLAAQTYVEATEAWGLSFDHESGVGTFALGGGAALFDMDGDGDDDLLLTSGNGAHRLFRNDGGGTFVNATSGSKLPESEGGVDPGGGGGVPGDGWLGNFGVATGDYDGDGLPDVYFTNNGPNRLMRNKGAGKFENVVESTGCAGNGMSTAASWADFDRDGDLDLYVGNYILQQNFPYHIGEPNRLWVNEGPASRPTFVDRAGELGVQDVGVFGAPPAGFEPGLPGEPTAGCTLSVSTLDHDDDGDADILVGNDFGMFVLPNRIYRNDTPRGGPLAFTDVSAETGFSSTLQYNMGIHGADYDRDGDWDLYLSDLGTNALLRNDDGVYVDVVEEAGPVEGVWPGSDKLITSWSTVWADVDHDGWEDLYVVNGYIPAAEFIANVGRARNGLWRNLGDGTFEWTDPAGEISNDNVGRGSVWGDLDGDGTIEIYVVNNGNLFVAVPGDTSRLFVRASPPAGHWATFRLIGHRSNAEALGSRVDAEVGDALLRRQVRDDSVYLNSPTRVVHFGLGDEERIDLLTIRWPSGTYQEWHDVAGDVAHRVEEPDVVILGQPDPGGAHGLVVAARNLGEQTRRYRLEGRVLGEDGTRVLAEGVLAPGARRDLVVEPPLAARVTRVSLIDPQRDSRDERTIAGAR